MHGETFVIHRSSNSDGFDPLAISQLYLSLEICAKSQAHCSLPGSPQGTHYFIDAVAQGVPADFMQGGQQALRLTTLSIDQDIPNHDFLLYRGSTVLQLSCQ